MKIIQALVILFAVVGCLALALGGYYIYTTSQNGEDNFLTRMRKANGIEATTATVAAAATPVPAQSEYAAVINQYQPTPTPAPAVAAVGAPGAVAAPALQPGVVVPAASTTAFAIKTPTPNEGKIRSWPTPGKKWVALTYDDGPHPEWTPKMIELLRSKNVKATFFLLGNMIERHPEIGKQLLDNGFEIGNHTYSHPNFNTSAMTKEKIKGELVKTRDLISQYITPQKIRQMRPPFGNTGPNKLEPVCEEMGLNIICWNIDTDDWRKEVSAEKMADNVMKNLTNGSIILMHDKHEKTYDCTAMIIDKIREQGYEFVTVSELLGEVPYGAGAGLPAAVAATAPNAATASEAPGLPAAGLPQPAAVAAPQTPLPVPAAVIASTPVISPPALDASKITQPPPSR